LWLLLFATGAVTVVIAIWRDSIVETLRPQREAIIDFQYSWVVPLIAMILISATPFSGRQLVLILMGLIYKLKVALMVSTAGVLLGELFCYFVFRTLFAARARRIEQKNVFYSAVAQSQRGSGIVFLTVVRYSFIPSRIISATQAISGVSLLKFMAAVVLSMPKQLSSVWIGALIAGNPDQAQRSSHTTLTAVLLVVTLVAGVIAFYEVCMRARRYYPLLRAQQTIASAEQAESSSPEASSDSSDLEMGIREKNSRQDGKDEAASAGSSRRGTVFDPIAR
ncbi:hypothetical protein JCM5350_005886, partial [Sporobolomyces pararoseus]